jgi:hypothetical protein
MAPCASFAARLIDIPGAVAVTLGGSLPGSPGRPDGDRASGSTTAATCGPTTCAPGLEGTVVQPGEWGRLANGAARLRWRASASISSTATSTPSGTGSRRRRRAGTRWTGWRATWQDGQRRAGRRARPRGDADGGLPRPEFTDALRQMAPARWRRSAASSLAVADGAAERHDVVACLGCSPRPRSRWPRRRSPSAASGR